MAFPSMLRRASSSVLPLAIRVGSRRTFHSAISAVLCHEKGSLGREVGRRSFLPFSHFSTTTALRRSADDNLVRVLESEIDCAEEPAVKNIPDGFPFKIIDNAGERTILLEKSYEDEIIKVEVDAPAFPEDGEDAEDGDDDENDAESAYPPTIPLVVNISKGQGQCLEFGITAYPDEITIDSLSIKSSETSEDQLAYEGPDFSDLDENLQKGLYKYLEIRGIKPSLTNFLFEYMKNKDDKEYLVWLKNLKGFMEK